MEFCSSVCLTLVASPGVAASRQVVRHGHVLVNGRMVNIPSFQCKVRNEIGELQEYGSLRRELKCFSDCILEDREPEANGCELVGAKKTIEG